MREIKLRVYDGDNGMHYLDIEETDDALVFRSDRHFDGWLFDGDLVVMQYTGYSDSRGREIYEGDIVRYEPKRKVVSLKFEITPIFSAEFSTTDRKEAECIVKFEFGGFVLVKEDDEKFIQLLHRALSEDEENELRVVGNIYEGVNGNA